MQQPYPPRLQTSPQYFAANGVMLSSPGGILFASPTAYSAHPFGVSALLSPEYAGQGVSCLLPHSGIHPTLHEGRHGSLPTMSSPLTPVPPSALASPFFPASAPLPALAAHSLAPSYAHAEHPHSHLAAFHASTSSVHSPQSRPLPRGRGKRASVSVAALRTRDGTLRSGSGTVSPRLSLPVRRDEPKRKKVVVRLPREMPVAVDDVSRCRAGIAIVRVPLPVGTREEVEADMAYVVEPVDAMAREQHPNEIRMRELPPEVDVYLPGRTAWEDVWDAFEMEMMDKHGYCDIRRPSFLPPVRGAASPVLVDGLFPRRAGHGRTASLFSTLPASLPPRLQSAVDSVRRNGHGPSLSLCYPGSLPALRSPSLSSPSLSPALATSPRRLTPLAPAFVPASALQTAAVTPLPRSPLGSPEQPQQRFLESLVVEAAGPPPPRELVTDVEEQGEIVKAEPAAEDKATNVSPPKGHESGSPSRRASGISTRTDRTGVASLSGRSWSDASDAEVVDGGADGREDVVFGGEISAGCMHEGADPPALSLELSRALSDLSLLAAHDALVTLPPLPPSIDAVDDEYALSDDSQYGDAELTEDEYSNPSEEEAARQRAVTRARSIRALRQQALRQVCASRNADDAELPATPSPKVLVDVPFEATNGLDYADLDDSPSSRAAHKVTQNFEFPPRSPISSPLKPRQPAQVALPDSSPGSGESRSLPSLAAQLDSPRNSLDFTESNLPFIPSPSFARRPHAPSSQGAFAFRSFGQPGSLAVSPSLLSDSPAVSRPIPPRLVAGELLHPRTSSAGPSGSPLQPTAVEFEPTLASSATSAFSRAAPTSCDFLPPAKAPTLSDAGDPWPAAPVPLTTVAPHVVSIKRQQIEDESSLPAIRSVPVERVASAPVLAHPQPRRPLPEPPVALDGVCESTSGDEVEVLRDDLAADLDERDPADESEVGNRSFVSVDDPLPEQYAPPRPVVGRRAAWLSHSVPSNVDNTRPPLPALGDDWGEQVSPARMGDPRARTESVDIALPSSLRAKSKAIPLSPVKASDVFDGTYGVPVSLTASPLPASSSSVIEASVVSVAEDELSFRTLEDLISVHFHDLKEELVHIHDQHQPALDDLVEKIGARVELALATQQYPPGIVLSALENMLDGVRKRIDQLVVAMLEHSAMDGTPASGGLRRPPPLEQGRSMSAPPPGSNKSGHPVDARGLALTFGAFIEDLRRDFQPLVRDPLEPDAVAAKVAAALHSQVTEICASLQQDASRPSSSQVTVVDPVALEKVNQPPDAADVKLPAHLAKTLESTLLADVRKEIATGAHDGRRIAAEAGLGAPSPFDAVQTTLNALKVGQEQLADAIKSSQEEQATLKTALGQHRHDLTARQDFAFTKLEEFLNTHLGSAAPSDAARVSDLEARLTKMRSEHDKVLSGKDKVQARLKTDRAHFASEVSELRQALKTLEREKQEVREALAASKAENSGLEKRLTAQVRPGCPFAVAGHVRLIVSVSAQDARLDALQRAKTVQQQSLALANERNAEHGAALASARARIAELEAALSAADDKVNMLEEENLGYRAKFSGIEQGLETMKATVKSELDEAAARIAALETERDRLADLNDRLARAAYDDAPPTPRQGHARVGPPVYPSPPSPAALRNGNGAGIGGHGTAPLLVPQHTAGSDGSDNTVAHTEFSPTPSMSGLSVVKDERDGWWSAVSA
ncbi:hypothetical protein JCM3770_005933 [Rhodotorula araucariae]